MDGLALDNAAWLRAFFSSPNELSWVSLADDTATPAIAEQVRPWLQALRSDDRKTPIVLPFLKDGTITGWYATTRSNEGAHELAAELKAWLGPTYVSLFEAVPDGTPDPMAAALREVSQSAVWRFTGPDKYANTVIAKRLGDYISLLGRRPKLKHMAARPVGAIRGDFERALIARDTVAAEGYIAELKATGRLNEENLRYLDVRLNAGLGLWPQIARDHWLIQTMSDLAIPPQILADIIEALYRTHIDAIESAGDAVATLAAFDTDIAKRYPRLFASRRGIRTPRVVKAFLLFEQLQGHPSAEIIDELGVLLDEGDLLQLVVPTAKGHLATTLSPEAEADEAFDDLQYDRAFVFYSALPLSKKNLGRLLTCVQFIGTDNVRERMLATIEALDPALIATLSPGMRDKLAELNAPAIGSALALKDTSDELSHQVAPEQKPGLNGWLAWAEKLDRAEDLLHAERAVQDAVTKWDTSGFKSNEADSRTFADVIGNLTGESAMLARRSVPQIFASFFPCDEVPSEGTRPVAEVLFALISMDDSLSASDLDLLAQLLSILLTLGLSNDDYVSLIKDLQDVQERVSSYAHLPWSLDVCETLAVSSAQSDTVREARLSFFVRILGQAQTFAHRLGPQDLMPMEFLAKDFGVDEASIDKLRRSDEADEEVPELADASGQLIGIYTLAEAAGSRAKVSLEKMFPGCLVEVNSDLVATDKLRNLARSANLFVFAWKSSTHAAFYCIKDELPNGEPIWAAGKGTASILRAVMENLN